jgi:hypothetical protein
MNTTTTQQNTDITAILDDAAWDALGVLDGPGADYSALSDATLDRIAGEFRSELSKARELLTRTQAEQQAEQNFVEGLSLLTREERAALLVKLQANVKGGTTA